MGSDIKRNTFVFFTVAKAINMSGRTVWFGFLVLLQFPYESGRGTLISAAISFLPNSNYLSVTSPGTQEYVINK